MKNLKKENKQFLWENWFVISIIVFFACFFIGTLDNSKTTFPNWLIFMLATTLNLLACIIVGSIKHK
jgi:hypothetical protein